MTTYPSTMNSPLHGKDPMETPRDHQDKAQELLDKITKGPAPRKVEFESIVVETSLAWISNGKLRAFVGKRVRVTVEVVDE